MRAVEVLEAAGEAFNVGRIEPTTQRSLVEALARTAGVEPTFVSIPRSTIHANGGQVMGENFYFAEVLDMQPLTSVVDKAAGVLGLEPTPLDGRRAEPTDDVNAPTILIVDDDPDMRLYLRGCLRGLGEAAGPVIDAADGVEALRRVRADGVGLVISDVVLPRMDGAGLRQAIRGDPRHVHLPVLLISGEQEAAPPSGPDDAFLAKPFNARELLAAVRRLLNLDGDGHP